MEKKLQLYKPHCSRFDCVWLILHRDGLLGVAFLPGQYSWFQFESLNQSINHPRKGRLFSLKLEYTSIHISCT